MSAGPCVPLDEADEEARFGGKAAQLAIARRHGLPVPDGVAFAWDIVDRIAEGDMECSDAFATTIAAFEGRPLAVRSSAVGEDSAAASFAGQHLTRLGVRSVEGLADAFRAVRESGRAPGPLAYRRTLGLAGAPRVAIVIQPMVVPDAAGVMFTKDPVTGADLRVIEAAWGLGESVVAGLLDPDRYRVRRGGEVVETIIGDKHIAVRIHERGDTHEMPVAEELRRVACLHDEALRELDGLASGCERAFPGSAAHDIEWAFEGGRLYLLQRRAVTR